MLAKYTNGLIFLPSLALFWLLQLFGMPLCKAGYPHAKLQDSLRWQTTNDPCFNEFLHRHSPNGVFTTHFTAFLRSPTFRATANRYLPSLTEPEWDSAITDLIGEDKIAPETTVRSDTATRHLHFSDVVMGSLGGFQSEDARADAMRLAAEGDLHPVVGVHGKGMMAGDMAVPLYRHYEQRKGQWQGRNMTFAASYSQNGFFQGFVAENIRLIRLLIISVYYYTGQSVDLLAFSFGVPTVVAAVQGGWMETQVWEGPNKFIRNELHDMGLGSIAQMVHVLVGVSGPMQGLWACDDASGIDRKGIVIADTGICDPRTGLRHTSSFLQSLTAAGYTAHRIHAKPDTTVGNDQIAGVKDDTSAIPGQKSRSIKVEYREQEPAGFERRWNHLEVLMQSVEMQSKLFGAVGVPLGTPLASSEILAIPFLSLATCASNREVLRRLFYTRGTAFQLVTS